MYYNAAKVSPVECFLEKATPGRSRSTSRGSSPGRSPVRYIDEQIQGFRVNIKPEKKSKFSSVVLKLRGIDQVSTPIVSFVYFNVFSETCTRRKEVPDVFHWLLMMRISSVINSFYMFHATGLIYFCLIFIDIFFVEFFF